MKLITNEIARKLLPAYELSAETGEGGKAVIAKYFTPWANATWFISEGMPVDTDGEPTTIDKAKDWHLFGFCDLGDTINAELGYVMLSDLESVNGPVGLKVERDLYYNDHALAEVMSGAPYGRQVA